LNSEQKRQELLENYNSIFKKYEVVRNSLALTLPKGLGEYSKIHLAPLNEFRNALFHIFKCFEEESDIGFEHREAEVHYSRAQFDAFEIYIEEKIRYINSTFKNVDCDIVYDLFRRYYDVILPEVNDLKYSLSINRTKRRKDSDRASEIVFNKYVKVENYLKEIESKKSVIAQEVKKRNRKKVIRFIWGAVISMITGCIIGLLGLIFQILSKL